MPTLDIIPAPRPTRSGPSEWGKLNAGQPYGILAVDFGRAIFGIAWGKYELPLICYLFENCWKPAKSKERGKGWPDPTPCKLNLNALATEWGFPRQRLHEAKDRLQAVGFLVERDGEFSINKNAHEWIDPKSGEPILSPQMLSYALKGRSRLKIRDQHTSVTPQRDRIRQSPADDVTVQRDSDSSDRQESVTLERDIDGQPCHAPALHGGTDRQESVTLERDIVSRCSVTSHIEERAPGDLENSIKDPPTPQRGEVVVGETSAESPSESKPSKLSVFSPDPTAVAALTSLARVVFGDRGELAYYPNQVPGWLYAYPADWVRDAILCTGAKSDIEPRGLAQYTTAILRRWHPKGPPRNEVEDARRALPDARSDQPVSYHVAPANSRHRRNPIKA